MKHWVNNLFCAVDIDITSAEGDLVGLCIAPMDSHIALSPKRLPITIEIYSDSKVDKAYLSNKTLKRYNDIGIGPAQARENLVQWFESLNLKLNRRIIPLSYNWPLKRRFLADWLGLDFDYIFDSRYRDIMCLASCMNDMAYQQLYELPYPKVDLSRLVTKFSLIPPKDLGTRTHTIIKLYRLMLGTRYH